MLWTPWLIAAAFAADNTLGLAELEQSAAVVFCGEVLDNVEVSSHGELPSQPVEELGLELAPRRVTFGSLEVLRGTVASSTVDVHHYGLPQANPHIQHFGRGERWLVYARGGLEGFVVVDTENQRMGGQGAIPLPDGVKCAGRAPVDVMVDAAIGLVGDPSEARAVAGLMRLAWIDREPGVPADTTSRAVPALAAALERGDEAVPWAVLALCARGPLCDASTARGRYFESANPRWQPVRSRDAAAATLLSTLDTLPESSRPAAILALAGVERPGVVERLATLSVSDQAPIRDAATLALAWFPGRPEARSALARAAEHDDPLRRELAIWGAGLGGMEAPWLSVLAEDPDPEVASAARTVLVRGDDDAAVADLRDRGLLAQVPADEWVIHAEPDGTWVDALRAALPHPGAWWALFRDLEARADGLDADTIDASLEILEDSGTGAHRQRALAVLSRRLGREDRARALEALLP